MPFETIVERVFLPQVDHLCTGVGLHATIGQRHGIKFAHRIIALQDAARILPGDRCTHFHLCPGDLGINPCASAALCHKVVDPALSRFRIARVPVLNGGIFDFGIIESDELHNGGMQLVVIISGRCAALEIAHERALFSNDQRALKLSGLLIVDAEIGRELHRAFDPFWDVDERAVRKDSRV